MPASRAERLESGEHLVQLSARPVIGLGSAQLLDADEVAGGIADGAVTYAVRLLGGLLDDLGEQCLNPVDGVGKGVPSRVSSEGQVKRGSR